MAHTFGLLLNQRSWHESVHDFDAPTQGAGFPVLDITQKSQMTESEYADLFFFFGEFEESPPKGPPLVCLNGGIMADSGNEPLSYIFTVQDRYPLYAAIVNMRCLLFVRDDDHQRRIETSLYSAKRHLDMIQKATHIEISDDFPKPLYMPCKIDHKDVRLLPTRSFIEQVRDPRIINSHTLGGVYLNQISPTIYSLLRQFYGFLKLSGHSTGVRLTDYRDMAQRALEWHDKTRGIDLLNKYKGDAPLPRHVPTVVFRSNLMKEMTWERLVNLIRDQTGCSDVTECFIKSGKEAAGEVSVVFNKGYFLLKKSELADGIAIKFNHGNRTPGEVQLIVQPRIERSRNDCDFPSSIGVTYNIRDTKRIERLAIVGHVYEDMERKTFIGSYMSDPLTQDVLKKVGEKKIITLLGLYAEQGYRGPINLDAVRNQLGEYIFIHDCNPRLGGCFPGLILKYAFERAGVRVETLMTLGYRGRILYPDLGSKLAELKRLGLLCTQDRQRGAYIVPSPVRTNGFDMVLVNMEMEETHAFIRSGHIHTLSDEACCDLKGVYM